MHKTVNGKTTIVGVGSISNQTLVDDRNHIVLCNGQAWYTRVGYYMDWIESYVGNDHC